MCLYKKTSVLKTLSLIMKVFGVIALHMILANATDNLEKRESISEDNFLEYLGNRIIKNVQNSQINARDWCLIQLLQEVAYFRANTYLLIQDDRSHESLLNSLFSQTVYSYYTQPDLLTINESKFNSFQLLIFGKKFKLENLMKQMKPYQRSKFFILVKNYKEALEIFNEMWKFRVLEVVAAFVANETVYYYTYLPYCRAHCGEVGRPQLLAKCNVTKGVFVFKDDIFPQKVKNLHGCPINVTFTENVPASYHSKSLKLTGWEIDLIKEILGHLNGVPNYIFLTSKKSAYNYITGYQRLVRNSEIGGGLVISLRGLAKTDFCLYGQSVCTTWIVPKRTDASQSADFLLKVFPLGVWLLLLLSFVVMASAYKILFKSDWMTVLFKLIPFVLGTGIRIRNTSKILGTTWLLFCLTMNAMYQSGYQSTLLVPSTPTQLSSTKDVLQSDLKILGVSDIITDAIPYFKYRYNISYRRLRLINRQLSYDDWIYRLTVKRDSAYLGFKETVKYQTDQTELVKKIYIPEECVMRYMLAFVLKKNSHLTESFLRFINRLNENGLSLHFMRKHLSREYKGNIPKKIAKNLKPLKCGSGETPPSINMKKMHVVFMCHAVGNGIAFLVFLIEIMSKWKWTKVKRVLVNEVKSAWKFDD